MRDVYSRFWLRQVQKYGYSDYHEQMISLVDYQKSVLPGVRILESGVGTGFPLALELAKRGWEVHGLDIAPVLIHKCMQNANESEVNIKCIIGDSEVLPYKDNSFDLTYCLQSSWYFPHLGRAIEELIRVTTPRGVVIFDIQNLWNLGILKGYIKNNIIHLLRIIKKIVLRRSLEGCVLTETPTNPLFVRSLLKKSKVRYEYLPIKPIGYNCLRKRSIFSSRLVFVCSKL